MIKPKMTNLSMNLLMFWLLSRGQRRSWEMFMNDHETIYDDHDHGQVATMCSYVQVWVRKPTCIFSKKVVEQ